MARQFVFGRNDRRRLDWRRLDREKLERVGHVMPRFVRRGRWLPYVLRRDGGEVTYLAGSECGSEVHETKDRAQAWAFDVGVNDEEIFRSFCDALELTSEEVLLLEDVEQGVLFEYRGYGFRRVERP